MYAHWAIAEGTPIIPRAHEQNGNMKPSGYCVLEERYYSLLSVLLFQNANEALYAPRHQSSYLSVMHQNGHILPKVGKQ